MAPNLESASRMDDDRCGYCVSEVRCGVDNYTSTWRSISSVGKERLLGSGVTENDLEAKSKNPMDKEP